MSEASTFQKKLSRIKDGGAPRVLDLFAGCGGLSLGFHRAGFQIAGAMELDPIASLSHACNFYKSEPEPLMRAHARARDITETEPLQFARDIGITGRIDGAFDVIIGGPPCQAFARVGRAKLREIAEHPEAFKLDPRGNLYLRYLDYVRTLRPLAILMENVPDVVNYGGHNIPEEVCESLEGLGYVCRYTLLNAVFYGVPEMRERMFLLAFRKELHSQPKFPVPTHYYRLPRGYEGSRQVALKTIKQDDLFSTNVYYTPQPSPGEAGRLPHAVTAEDALSDLPRITEHLTGGLTRGARRFDTLLPYPRQTRISDFAKLMRSWPGFEGNEGVLDHVIRSLPRDYQIFRRMNPGDEYPEAYQHALTLFEERLAKERKASGRAIRPGTKQYEALKRSIVPPYDPGKFPNKWRKMEPDQPARTLMAHLGKDSYSHIHYDSTQARTISVREAARLQSFPDGFRFSGTMNPAFRQIGNAVPPLLAYRLALSIREGLGIAQ